MSVLKEKLPNILTFLRMVAIPIIIYSFYTHSKIINIISATLFGLASLTDFLDGYLARKNRVQSNFGRCFDPIADKLLVSVTLIMLVNFSNQNLYILIPSIIIICREILVSGLREFLATINVKLPVIYLGKLKTAIQMIAIIALLLAGQGSEYVYGEIMNFIDVSEVIEVNEVVKVNFEGYIQLIGEVGLAVSSFLTILSGYVYLKIGMKHF